MYCFSRDAWILKEENRAGMGLENRDFFGTGFVEASTYMAAV